MSNSASEQVSRRLAYVIHDAVCTAYKHEGRNALCERAAIAAMASEWLDDALADAKAEALNEAADAIQALHPGEVKNSVIFLRERASLILGGKS